MKILHMSLCIIILAENIIDSTTFHYIVLLYHIPHPPRKEVSFCYAINFMRLGSAYCSALPR